MATGVRARYTACMTPAEIIAAIEGQWTGKLLAALPADKHPRVHVAGDQLRSLAEFLHSTPPIRLDWMCNLTGIDYIAEGKMAVLYDLWSFDHRHALAVKAYVERDNPVLPSVSDLWPIADWHEREAFDLLGIRFAGHPDLRRILLADDWEGYPLRKDYTFPREYHGIPGSVELDWQQQV